MEDLSGICVGLFILFIVLIVLYFIFKDAFSSNTKPPLQEYQRLQGIDIPQPSMPQTQNPPPQIIKEKEIIKEVVKVKCPYCGALVDQGVDRCPHCGAPLR
jgi:hypothetical protein